MTTRALALQALAKTLTAIDSAQRAGVTAPQEISKMVTALAKSYGGDVTTAKLVLFAKGLIGPADITVTGALTAQQSRSFITTVFKNEFLKNVTTDAMGKLKKEGNVLGVPSRALRSVAEGQEPDDDDLAEVANTGYVLDAQAWQLFSNIGFSLLIDNQDNPELPSIIENGFMTQISGEMVDLAWNGTGVVGDGKFLALNEGWLKKLDAAATAGDSQRCDVTPVTTGWYATLGAMFGMVPAKWKSQCVAMMNTNDADRYAHERGEDAVRSDDGRSRQYNGYNILPCEYMPEGHIVVGPSKFLVFGLAKDVTRARQPHARKRVIELTFDGYCDFDVAVPEAFVHGAPPAGP